MNRFKSGNKTSRGLAKIGAHLGKQLAKNAMRKKMATIAKRKPKGKRNGAMSSMLSGIRMSAPVTTGYKYNSGPKANTFSVPFSVALLQVIVQDATSQGAIALSRIGNTANPSANVAISPFVASGGTANLPNCFPPHITRLAQSFSRYRLQPGRTKMSYRTSVPTSTPGSLAVAIYPADDPIQENLVGYQVVSAAECAMICPAWAAEASFKNDALQRVIHTDDLFKYCDFDGAVSQPEVRQDTLFNIMVSGLGFNPAAAGSANVIGYLFLEGVLQFQHLQENLAVVAATPPVPQVTSTSTTPIHIEVDGEHEMVDVEYLLRRRLEDMSVRNNSASSSRSTSSKK